MKDLSEMSLQELWRLFPVRLSAHSDAWASSYAAMEQLLYERLRGMCVVRISHIGSTAVPGIMAKPIVDILLEIGEGSDMSAVAREIQKLGFIRMSSTDGRMSFNMGYTPSGFAEKVYHLHLRFAGDNDELYFRDLIASDPELAKEYEALKLKLSAMFRYDRDAYTAAKGEFVARCTASAKEKYGNRYS